MKQHNYANLTKIAFPVQIRGDLNTNDVYELSELLETFQKMKRQGHNITYKLTDLEPVRYPGFKNYAKTIELLKLITNQQWRKSDDLKGEPSDADGAGMDAIHRHASHRF